MAGQLELAPLLTKIYDAALEPERWPEVHGQIGDALGGSASMLGIQSLPDGTVKFIASSRRIDLRYVRLYSSAFADPRSNPTLRALLTRPVGKPLIGGRFQDRYELYRTDVYNELMRPQQLQDGALALLLREPGHCVMWSVMQRHGAEPFSDDDERLLRFLAPHLQRSIEVFLRLGALSARAEVAEAVLDHLPLGVVVVGAHGRVLRLNRAAEKIVASGDGLLMGRDGLGAASPSESRALQRLIAGAVATGRGDSTGAGGAISLSRPSGAQPLSILVSPFSGNQLAVGPGLPAAIVFIGSPDLEATGPADLLRRLYGLTRAEASLAAILLQGKDLTEAASELGVTMNTIRTQLRSVFDKTGARRQSELVRMLLRGPAGLLS